MELIRVSDRVWYSMYEVERDRPCLGYVRGDRWSLAVDAGHSDAHGRVYCYARRAQLPLPSITVVTHWHWDHAFGMHHTNGICIANSRTNQVEKNTKVFENKYTKELKKTLILKILKIRRCEH